MAQLNGLFRLGRDAEQRYTTAGDSVVSVALAYNYGKKNDEGNRPTQWVDGAVFGKMGEALLPYLKKGTQIYATMDDVHVRSYEKKDGTSGAALSATLRNIELAGSKGDAAPAQRPAPSAPRQESAPTKGKTDPFADFESDIPY